MEGTFSRPDGISITSISYVMTHKLSEKLCQFCLTNNAARKGRPFCSKKCAYASFKGKPSWNKGLTWSEETKIKMGLPKLGKTAWNKGKKAGEHPGILSAEQINTWKGGVTPAHEIFRKSRVYREWRTHVFKRDDYTCQACGERGGELHADHELPFSEFPDLRLEILNGRTLCEKCHRKTPTWGNFKRNDLSTYFFRHSVTS